MTPDLVLVNPGSRAKIYQSLGARLTAVENPVWAGLIATFVRVKRTSLKLLFGREATMCDHALHLVDMFMLPSNDIATVLSWRTGAESATRISWKHAGLRDCSATIIRVGILP